MNTVIVGVLTRVN